MVFYLLPLAPLNTFTLAILFPLRALSPHVAQEGCVIVLSIKLNLW